MSQEWLLNISEEQKIYNMIEILTSSIKSAREEIRLNLEDDKRYAAILKREENVYNDWLMKAVRHGQENPTTSKKQEEEFSEKMKKMYEDSVDAVKTEKKAIMEEFKAREELLYNRLDQLKTQLEGRKDALVQCFLRNMKADVPSVIYKEKSNGKKIRVEISLNPKMKTLKGSTVTDEELRQRATDVAEQVIAK